jgi:hypothetical protein
LIYVLLAVILLSALIIIKWDLKDPSIHRWRTSNEENRIGYALLTFVMVAGIAAIFFGGML